MAAAFGEGGRPVRRLLIFRLGSLGDTLVALPALHLLARRFPQAERRVLTNYGVSDKAASMASLLDGSGLVHGYFRFPPRGLKGRALLDMLAQLRHWRPDALVYLHEPRGTAVALRDAAFFRACGIRRMVGVPWAQELSRPRLDAASRLYEHQTALLARRLAELGDCAPSDPASWDLRLSAAETGRARALLAPLAGGGILAMSIGAKTEVQDWGDANWNALLARIGPQLRGWSLVALGVQGEHARSEALLAGWPGPRLNLCGLTSPRESAAVLKQSDLYLGHDSGPMHLAATVGTPCVAIFSAHNPPGVWFPHGAGHRVLYHKTECYGCALSVCVAHARKCILSIGVEEAAAAVLAAAPKRS